MKIAVCIKQVPDTTDIKWTKNNTIQREGVESVINPFDEYALETAIRIKEKFGAEVTAFTMGPNQAEEILRKAIAMGADYGVLISDKKFSGSDTIATSRTIAAAIKTALPKFDLIICGQFAVDGDTAQTGPSIAENLQIPQITYANEIVDVLNNHIIVKKEVEDGSLTIKMEFPGLICMQKCDYEPRIPSINGYIKSQDTEIQILNCESIGLTADDVGIKGSPTCVSKAFRPEEKISGEIMTPPDAKTAAKIIYEEITEIIEKYNLTNLLSKYKRDCKILEIEPNKAAQSLKDIVQNIKNNNSES